MKNDEQHRFLASEFNAAIERYLGYFALDVSVEAAREANTYFGEGGTAETAIRAAAARLAARCGNSIYKNERVIGMAIGNLLQPQNAVNDYRSRAIDAGFESLGKVRHIAR